MTSRMTRRLIQKRKMAGDMYFVMRIHVQKVGTRYFDLVDRSYFIGMMWRRERGNRKGFTVHEMTVKDTEDGIFILGVCFMCPWMEFSQKYCIFIYPVNPASWASRKKLWRL